MINSIPLYPANTAQAPSAWVLCGARMPLAPGMTASYHVTPTSSTLLPAVATRCGNPQLTWWDIGEA